MKHLGRAFLLVLLGCTPTDIAMATCHDEMLAVADPWYCDVHGDTVARASLISFDTESRNQVAEVEINLRVQSGTLRVSYRDLEEEHKVLVTPEAPLVVSMRTRLQPQSRSFTLHFEPQGAKVTGLTGSVNYSTP